MSEFIDKGVPFLERLDAQAKSQETFSLIALTMHLTFDVIGKVALETDLDAQYDERDKRCETIRVFENLLDEYQNEFMNLPWWLTPIKVFRRARVARRLHALLKDIVRKKHAELHEPDRPQENIARSVLSLSLKDIKTLTPEVLDETADQVRTFLFAGHDSTSVLLAWVFYELSRTPHVLQAVRAEHDKLLGPAGKTPAEIRARLLEREDSLQDMPYTNAVIKETLRFHPPAGTGRYIPPGTGLNLRLPEGKEMCADGLQIYICPDLVHRDREVYGETADLFLPERWLEEGVREIPAGAWRPFERGPRNCIGQELAIIEARVIIAMAARRYNFIKVGLGEVALDPKTGQPSLDPATNGQQYKVTEELYPVSCIANPISLDG